MDRRLGTSQESVTSTSRINLECALEVVLAKPDTEEGVFEADRRESGPRVLIYDRFGLYSCLVDDWLLWSGASPDCDGRECGRQKHILRLLQ
jgi:hypothetical protein